MQQVPLNEAQEQLLSLVNAALQGETVLIVRDDQHTVQLVPVAPGKQPRKAGSAKGLVWIADDFDAPLPDFREYSSGLTNKSKPQG
jgi:antitoxin (DNA-binding transcriptional repressor) of toxin-antitoxin stability system